MKPLRFLATAGLALAALAGSVAPARAADDDAFYLKDGDRVVFYGDSITEQLLYTTFAETYAVTRFPKRNVSFTHSGWGGDRVGGGGGGPIDRRLERDVEAYRPSVVTIMLGMNDASYRPFTQNIFDTYAAGYRHIVDKLKQDLPNVRLTLIKPSPYDDITREPKFEGGYNAVLLRYAEFVGELAKSSGSNLADLNNPVVDATKKAFEADKEAAVKLNQDRIHPGPGGQLVMAQALLKAWKAPALVSSVSIDAKESRVAAENTAVSDLTRDGETLTLTWTELDEALPFPVDLKDPIVALAVKSSDFFTALDQQTLKVAGLTANDYTLKIDGDEVGTFSKDALGAGINLAEQVTPMTKQAIEVHKLTLKHNNFHKTRWRTIQVPYQGVQADHLDQALKGLDAIESDFVAEQHAAAQPVPHKFELKPKS